MGKLTQGGRIRNMGMLPDTLEYRREIEPSLDDAQKRLLEQPPGKDKISYREQKTKQGKIDIPYLKSWYIIQTANRIFQHEWSSQVEWIDQVCKYEAQDGSWIVGYRALVSVTAGGITHQGIGYGSGQRSDLYQAMESAGKEAETDALKRCLVKFGEAFGLALEKSPRQKVSESHQTSQDSPQQQKKEETPQDTTPPEKSSHRGSITDKQLNAIKACLRKSGIPETQILKDYALGSLEELEKRDASDVISFLQSAIAAKESGDQNEPPPDEGIPF